MATYVLDSSAFLAGVSLNIAGELLIPSPIEDELSSGTGKRRVEETLARGARIVSASPESLKTVRGKAKETGDLPRLSDVDVEVVAIALENEAIVVSDDYGIQNLCKAIGLEFQPLAEEGIKKEWKWKNRCTGCGRWLEGEHKDCPVCGSPVKAKKVR